MKCLKFGMKVEIVLSNSQQKSFCFTHAADYKGPIRTRVSFPGLLASIANLLGSLSAAIRDVY